MRCSATEDVAQDLRAVLRELRMPGPRTAFFGVVSDTKSLWRERVGRWTGSLSKMLIVSLVMVAVGVMGFRLGHDSSNPAPIQPGQSSTEASRLIPDADPDPDPQLIPTEELAKPAIDLLALVNPAREAVAGQWSKKGKRLVGASQGVSRPCIRIPITLGNEYILKTD